MLGACIVLSLGAKDLLYERRTLEDGVVYYERRLDWMPFPEFIVGDPLCMECQRGLHGQCSDPDRIARRGARYPGFFPAPTLVLSRSGEISVIDWQCSCADCSHTDVSG